MQLKDGITLRVKRGDVVRVVDWINKNGTDVLFVAKIGGMYKIHGIIKE